MAQPQSRAPFSKLPQPEPFHRTPEFRRGAWLIGILAAFSLAALWRVRSLESASDAPPARFEPIAELSAEQKAERERRIYTLWEGALADSKNGEDFRETGGFRRLTELVASTPAEDARARTTSWLDRDRARLDPDSLRGEFVRVRGIPAGFWTQRLERPILGHRDIWRGVLTDGEGEDGVAFDMLERPAELTSDVVRREAIDIEGVFYRNVQFEAENGAKRTAPYVIARNLRVVDSRDGGRDWLQQNTLTIVALCVFVILAWRLLLSWFRRRQRGRKLPPGNPTIREMMEQRLAETRRRGPPPAPPLSP